MGNEDHRSAKILQGFQQHVLGMQIQVVGGFVQNQQVYRPQQKLQQGQAALLPTRKHIKALEHVVPSEQEGAQHVPHPGNQLQGCLALDIFQHRGGAAYSFRTVLGEVAHRHTGSLPHAALEGGILLGKDFQQGGLSGAIAAHHHQPLPLLQHQVQLAQHLPHPVVGLADTLQCQHQAAGMGGGGKGKTHLFQGLRNLHLLGQKPVQHLLPFLGLGSLGGLCPEATDEVLQLANLLLLLLVDGHETFQLHLTHLLVVGVVASIAVQLPIEQLVDLRNGGVKEVAVVAYQQEAARK